MAPVVAALLALGGALWLYETRWPPQAEDNELSRIGAPMPGARIVGGPYTSAGSVTCIDACLERTQGYSASGTLEQFWKDAARTLVARGYTISSQLGCIQYSWPVVTEGHWWLDCTVEGTNSKFSTTVWARFYRTYEVVPTSDSEYHVPDPPLSMSFSQQNGDGVAVSVAMN